MKIADKSWNVITMTIIILLILVCNNQTTNIYGIEITETGQGEYIRVTDIELEPYDEKLSVGNTLMLSPEIIPSNATESDITYSSNDRNIATVNSKGEIRGIAPGIVTISLTAGNFTKSIEICVKTETTNIELNNTYIILKENETYQLICKAKPKAANQVFSYKSVNPEIAEVSETGMITAKNVGSTSIIVSNEDMGNAVTVIINASSQKEGSIDKADNTEKEVLFKAFEINILEQLSKNTVIEINQKDIEILTPAILKQLYKTQKSIIIVGENYSVILQGKDIVNYQNKLNPSIEFQNVRNGVQFVLNENHNLPGMIQLNYSRIGEFKYLYLYNEAKEKFEKLNDSNMTNLKLDIAGTYLLSNEDVNRLSIQFIIIGIMVIVVFVFIACLFIKKRYWFW